MHYRQPLLEAALDAMRVPAAPQLRLKLPLLNWRKRAASRAASDVTALQPTLNE